MEAANFEHRYKAYLQTLELNGAALLDQLSNEAERFVSRVTEGVIQAHLEDLIDRINASYSSISGKERTCYHFSRKQDIKRCVEFRLHSLHWKIPSLEQRPGHELELGFAYLEREVLENYLYDWE